MTDLDATGRAVKKLREMIVSRRISPGQQLRQEVLAEDLGVSRSPLREAFRTLESEGLVVHWPNQGYFAARLRSAELQQIYLMRRLLETELLRTLRAPTAPEVSELRGLNRRMKALTQEGDLTAVLHANQQFHFQMFALSPLNLVQRQVERLWQISEPYRAAYLSIPASRERIVDEHAGMLEALANGDTGGLVERADRHREEAVRSVVALLRHEEGA